MVSRRFCSSPGTLPSSLTGVGLLAAHLRTEEGDIRPDVSGALEGATCTISPSPS